MKPEIKIYTELVDEWNNPKKYRSDLINKKWVSLKSLLELLNETNKQYCWRLNKDGSVCGHCEPCRLIEHILLKLKKH